MAYIRVVPASPLLFSDRNTRTNIIRSLDYIPGTAVRGALAALYISYKYGEQTESRNVLEQDELFQRVFVNGEVRFGNLYPESSAPVPASAWTCKLHPGFCADSDDRIRDMEKHGVFDIRLDSSPPDKCLYQQHGKKCENLLTRVPGFYSCQDGIREKRKVKKRLIAHNALSEWTRTTKAEAGLYSYEVIEETNDSFLGFIQDDNNLLSQLGIGLRSDDFLKFSNSALTLGLGRSRGLGRVHNCEIGLSAYDKFHDFLKDNGLTKSAGSDSCFSITLYSDAIMLDHYLRIQTSLTWAHLIQEFRELEPGLEALNFECSNYFVSTRVVAGWNVKHGLPKPKDVALNKGSVFVYKTAKPLAEAQKDVLNNFFTLIENEGIGERKGEGFGRVMVNDPFHVQPLDIHHIRE